MKRVGLFGCIVAAALLAPVGASADDQLKLTIGQRGNWDTAVAQLGTKAGIFKKHKLELEMIYTSGSGETLQPVVSGSVDLGLAVGTLLAETKLSNRGVGFLIINSYSTFNMPRMYSLLIVVFVLAIGVNAVISRFGNLDAVKTR